MGSASGHNSTTSIIADPMDLSGERAAQRASDAQEKAAGRADDQFNLVWRTQREDSAPWRQAGTAALSQLKDNNFMDNWQQDPGYQFRMQEGMKAINNAASARGMANSGATLKALTRFGQDSAAQEYNNVYNRNYQRLSGLAGIGADDKNQMLQQSANIGSKIAENYLSQGNATAAQAMGQSASNKQMVGQVGGGLLSYFSDERLKTNIEPISKEELAEMKKHLKAYAFNYISDEFGKGDWIGVMAQDLEKSKLGRSLVFENEHGQKKINQKKVLSLFLATMAEA